MATKQNNIQRSVKFLVFHFLHLNEMTQDLHENNKARVRNFHALPRHRVNRVKGMVSRYGPGAITYLQVMVHPIFTEALSPFKERQDRDGIRLCFNYFLVL
jgi:hypothetical protein